MNFRNRTWLLLAVLQLGAISAALAQTQVANPTLSVASGTSSSNVAITVSDITASVTIYYTTNGTAPTTSSSSVPSGGTIILNLNTPLELQAYQGSNNPSSVVTATYTANGLITSGGQHALALKNDGTIWAWGNNSSGQLGNGSTSATSPPVQVPFTGANPIASVTSSKIPFENGLPIAWELEYFGETGLDPTSSPNGNGLTLLQDYQQGNDPTNYYSQNGQVITPTISIVSGTPQTSATGSFAPQPLVVQVTNSNGGAVLTNAPVTFTVDFASFPVGQVASDPLLGTPSVTLQAVTDVNGKAQVYFQQPTFAGVTSQVSATAASSQTVIFTATTPPDNGPPAAPSNLTITAGAVGSGQVNLSWTNNADNATSIIIQDSIDGATWTNIVTLADATSTSYVASGLTPGQSYFFKEIAVNNNGSGGASIQAPDNSNDPSVNSNAQPTTAPITPQYAVVDLGPYLPTKISNSGIILMSGTTSGWARWQNNVITPLVPNRASDQSTPGAWSAYDMAEDGAVVGREAVPNSLQNPPPNLSLLDTWSASAGTPTSAPITATTTAPITPAQPPGAQTPLQGGYGEPILTDAAHDVWSTEVINQYGSDGFKNSSRLGNWTASGTGNNVTFSGNEVIAGGVNNSGTVLLLLIFS